MPVHDTAGDAEVQASLTLHPACMLGKFYARAGFRAVGRVDFDAGHLTLRNFVLGRATAAAAPAAVSAVRAVSARGCTR
jgi:hypothetical protein